MAFRYDTYDNSGYANRIGALLLRHGDLAADHARTVGGAQARAAEQGGAIRAGAARNIGSVLSGAIGDVIRQREEAPQREMAQLQLQNAREAVADRARARTQQTQADHDEMAARIGHEILLGGGTPESVQAAMGRAVQSGALQADEAQQFVLMSVEHAEKIPDAAKALLARSASGQAFLEKLNAPKPKAPLINRDPTHDLVDPETRQVVLAGTPKAPTPDKPPTVGSFEDYVMRAAKAKGLDPAALSTQDIEAARKAYQQADDRPRVDVHVGGGANDGLDPDGLELLATQYRIQGTSAIPTRISGTDRAKLINIAAKQAKALGSSPAQVIQKQYALKSDGAALTKMTTMASAAEAFETKAIAQAELVRGLSAKVKRTEYPVINSVLQSGREATGNTDAHLFANGLLTFTTEYAKLMEGSTGSAAGSSDAARKDAARLISTALTNGTIDKTLDQMKWEMQQTRRGYGVVIDGITQRMGGTPAAASAATIYARDPQGKVHSAKAGTPLPAGWVQVEKQ